MSLKSKITRDVALLELFKLRGIAPPQDVVVFFAAAGAEIGDVTGPVHDLAERVRLATELGAVAYMPSGRGGAPDGPTSGVELLKEETASEG